MGKGAFEVQELILGNQSLLTEWAAQPFHDMLGPVGQVGQVLLADLSALAPDFPQEQSRGELRLGTDSIYMEI